MWREELLWNLYHNAHISMKINSLGPRDVIWWHKSGSTLAQVMACCQMAPSHYLNQCWLIITEVQWYWSDDRLQEIPQPSMIKISMKITCIKFDSNLPGDSELNASETTTFHKQLFLQTSNVNPWCAELHICLLYHSSTQQWHMYLTPFLM